MVPQQVIAVIITHLFEWQLAFTERVLQVNKARAAVPSINCPQRSHMALSLISYESYRSALFKIGRDSQGHEHYKVRHLGTISEAACPSRCILSEKRP